MTTPTPSPRRASRPPLGWAAGTGTPETGSLAKQDVVPETAGTMKTDNKLFVGLLVFVIFIISALTFFPTLALGPLAEGLVA